MRDPCCTMLGAAPPRPESVEVDETQQLARELNALSVREREQVFEEVHGVCELVEETPSFVQECLQKMRSIVSKFPAPKRRSFDRAIFLQPSLEHDDRFHLKFLRSERFDAAKAAQCICLHFDSKLELFGENKLVKKITYEDLSEEDLETMIMAPSEALSADPNRRDNRGRYVLMHHSGRFRCNHWQSYARCIWYHIQTVAENENAQIHGVIYVLSVIGSKGNTHLMFDTMWRSRVVLSHLPVRSCGLHLCYDDKRVHGFFKTMLQNILAKDLRLRVKFHYGSAQEIRYSLLTFGVHGDFLEDPEGPKVIELMYTELERRRGREVQEVRARQETELTGMYIMYPGLNDILVGRGRPYRDHSGGRHLSSIVSLYANEYRQAERRPEKTQISIDIVRRIHQDRGRFIQRCDDGWKVVDDHVAREKVSQALRMEVRARNSKAQESKPLEEIGDHGSGYPSPDSKRLRIDY